MISNNQITPLRICIYGFVAMAINSSINRHIRKTFLTHEEARIQNVIVPQWKMYIREAFDRIIPLGTFRRRLITVHFADNFLPITLMVVGFLGFVPKTAEQIASFILITSVYSVASTFFRKIIYSAMANHKIFPKYAKHILPNDCQERVPLFRTGFMSHLINIREETDIVPLRFLNYNLVFSHLLYGAQMQRESDLRAQEI